MHRLRSTWSARTLVTLLVASLASLVIPSTQQAADDAVSRSYARWLRTQLAGPAPEAVDAALEAAVEADAASLEDFLRAFVAAYGAGEDEARWAELFSVALSSDRALISHLQRRFLRLAPEAAGSQALLAAASLKAAAGPDRPWVADRIHRAAPPVLLTGRLAPVEGAAADARPRHLLTSAQPLGP